MICGPNRDLAQALGDLRAQLLRLTLIGTAVAAVGWLVAVAGGLLHSPTEPWDGLGYWRYVAAVAGSCSAGHGGSVWRPACISPALPNPYFTPGKRSVLPARSMRRWRWACCSVAC